MSGTELATAIGLPSPASLGLPQFTDYYPGQAEGIQAVVEAVRQSQLDGVRRLVAICAPTAWGKSLLSAVVHRVTGARTAHLTETKALQTQMMRDFSGIGLTDIRGQNGYECWEGARTRVMTQLIVTVDDGPCHGGFDCPIKEYDCLYYAKALPAAKDAKYLTTNYAYWMTQHEYGGGLGEGNNAVDWEDEHPFGLLVCDEADTVFDSLTSFMAVSITEADAKQYCGRSLPKRGSGLADLQWWLKDAQEAIQARLGMLSTKMRKSPLSLPERRQQRRLQQLTRDLTTLMHAEGDWVCTWTGSGSWTQVEAAPVWPTAYLERYLYLDIPVVVLMSATLPEKEVQRLSAGREVVYLDFPSRIPVADRRVTPLLMTGMSRKRANYGEWVTKLDNIIGARLDRKILLHTTSYDRAKAFMRMSRWADQGVLIEHASRGAEAAIQLFKASKPPAVLVSPSMTRGVDLPGDDCRTVIIGKWPWPSTTDPLVKARSLLDPEYAAYEAVKLLQQEAGRAVRYVGDWCEVFLADGDAGWAWRKSGHLANQWFRDSWGQAADMLPKPRRLEE